MMNQIRGLSTEQSSIFQPLSRDERENFGVDGTQLKLSNSEWKIAIGRYGSWILIYQGELTVEWEAIRAECALKRTRAHRKIAPIGLHSGNDRN